MIEEDVYIWQKLTTWDRIRSRAYFAPFVLLFAFVIFALGSGVPLTKEILRSCITVIVTASMIALTLRISFARKITRLRNEYQEYIKWLNK